MDGLVERFNKTLKQMPTQEREFQPGDRVMVLVPVTASKFLATWQGPYTDIERVGPVTYLVRQLG